MNNIKNVLQELDKLNTYNKLDIEQIDNFIAQSKNSAIQKYLNSLKSGTKPETATSELFVKIINNNNDFVPEVRLQGGGFVDFIAKKGNNNPVLIELKPTFVFNDKKTYLQYRNLNFAHHKEQVTKYLKSNDYLVLTNLNQAYLFNRDVLSGEFKPFHTLKFIDLIVSYLENDNLWGLIRRLDNNFVKSTLEQEFFVDLSRWYSELNNIKFCTKKISKEELIVLFINKIIFIKTLEDYALIPFNFLVENYVKDTNNWRPKGYHKVFESFFNYIEKWFWEFYDTELFQIKIWDFIDKTPANITKFKQVFERVLGFGVWEKTFGKGMIHYDYRKIDEDVFGKAYETFIAKQKKDSGIYYTHRLITQYMTTNFVKSLFDDKINHIIQAIDNSELDKLDSLFTEIQMIKIADTCSGSGSFLIKVLREIYQQYQRIDQVTNYVNDFKNDDILVKIPKYIEQTIKFREKYHFNDYRKLLASIIFNHIYAIDIDERALETAKTNIWKEAVKLKPQIFNFNELGETEHVLPNLAVNFVCGDALYDLPLEQQINYIYENFKIEVINLHKIRDNYANNLQNPQVLSEIKSIKTKIRNSILKNIEDELFNSLLEHRKPILIVLEFFHLYFAKDGEKLKNSGFSGIISNPPWEVIKPVQKEFANQNKNARDVLDFSKWFKRELKNNIDFKQNWQNYSDFYKLYSKFLRNNYKYQGIGDLNFYKMFAERDLQLIQANGFMNILIPSGIQTDKGCMELRKLFINNNKLRELYSFEDRGYKKNSSDRSKVKIFPDVDSRFKFTIVDIQKTQLLKDYSFNGLFYLQNPNELYKNKPIIINADKINTFSPESFSIMEFKHEKDYLLCTKIRGKHKTFGELDIKLRAEFHMTNDSNLFVKNRTQDNLVLFEGKMIHQFNANFNTGRYFINENQANNALLRKEVSRIRKLDKKFNVDIFNKSKFLLDYQTYRLVYRAIARSTDELTLISTIVPKNVFAGNSIHCMVNCNCISDNNKIIQQKISYLDVVFYMALFNSLTLNYFTRNKISANLSMGFIYELPIASVPNKLKKQIVAKAFTLLYAKSNSKLYEDLREELGLGKINSEDLDLIKIRAELEVIIAKELYKLNKADWEHLTSTFIYGKNETKKELDKIIAVSKEIF
jgi:hypothetical protein